MSNFCRYFTCAKPTEGPTRSCAPRGLSSTSAISSATGGRGSTATRPATSTASTRTSTLKNLIQVDEPRLRCLQRPEKMNRSLAVLHSPSGSLLVAMGVISPLLQCLIISISFLNLCSNFLSTLILLFTD